MEKADAQERSLMPLSDRLSGLIDDARSLRLSRSTILDFSMRLRNEGVDISAVVDASLDAKEIDAAFALMAAGILCGFSPSAEQVGRLLPFVENILHISFLIGHCSGDRISVLLDAVESGHLSHERETLSLLLIALLLEGKSPPPRLLTQIRTLARTPLDMMAGMTLGHAARIIGDEHTNSVARRWIELSSQAMFRSYQKTIQNIMDQDLESYLSEQELITADDDITYRRSVEKVGRNEPCPCGSGKKYKKCCIEKDRERLSNPSPVKGVTMDEYRRQIHRHLTAEELRLLPVRDLIKLDFHAFTTGQLILVMRKLIEHRMWKEAENMMEALSCRQDIPDGECIDNYRYDLIYEAVAAGNSELMARQIEKLEDQSDLDDELRIHLDLIRPTEKTLAHLDEVARDGLQNPEKGSLIDLAYALLKHYPALGIVCARGCLSVERDLDSITVLDYIERARDTLMLPPGDDAQMIYDMLLDESVSRNIKDDEGAPSAGINAEDLKEMESLREKLKEMQVSSQALESQTKALEKKLRESEHALSLLKQREPALKDAESDQEEIERLRNKVRELKGIAKESHDERSRLRHELSGKNLLIEKKQDGIARPSPQPTREEPDAEETEAPSIEHRASYIPIFSKRAADEIRSTPGRAGREALQLTGRLAGIDTISWSKVKQLRRLPETYSARVDRSHRLLFRIDSGTGIIHIEAFVQRKDLETAIKNIS
ncbi:MAG: SEC-C metal-binding domain-containing protein [Vulcanimicrobiota bacterium]